jgi:hypothetical protein
MKLPRTSPGDDLLAHLLAILVGPALDQPQQGHDLPQVAAAKLSITIQPTKPIIFITRRDISETGIPRGREGEAAPD